MLAGLNREQAAWQPLSAQASSTCFLALLVSVLFLRNGGVCYHVSGFQRISYNVKFEASEV